MLIYILIYGIGALLCYFLFRFISKNHNDDNWLLIDRLIVATLSIGSWVTVILYLLFVASIFIFKLDPDKKVKW